MVVVEHEQACKRLNAGDLSTSTAQNIPLILLSLFVLFALLRFCVFCVDRFITISAGLPDYPEHYLDASVGVLTASPRAPLDSVSVIHCEDVLVLVFPRMILAQ